MVSEIVRGYLERHSTDELVNNVLLYGIEIEFSELGGLLEYGEPQPDEDSAAEHLENEDWEDVLVEAWNRSTSIRRNVPDNELRRVAAVIVANWGSDLSDLINQCTEISHSSLVQDRLGMLLENWEGDDSYVDVDGWTHCKDATRGIVREYQTDRPVNREYLENRITRLFDIAGDECNVPLNGSNHIHVSFPNSHHSASQTSRLHCCILYELAVLVREAEFPDELYRRWKNHSDYFRFHAPPGEKFSPVHCHSQGTWEFRLWGALDDIDEIMKCVDISGKAVVNGYRRFIAGTYAIADAKRFRESFSSFMKDRIEKGLNTGVSMPDLPDIGLPSPMFHVACGSAPWDSSYSFNEFNSVSYRPHTHIS